ncbi:integrase, catalytic region, zinc finger, CCHC-type containing protein [Tanacetum coccineum]|uniref:Integrase, catalytic region, zinc finger, CCHC-type containing protein n=1 Tax=Tanacetum coccineum TaxID=301880 RepID=A0ABQ5DJR4_9ASTR
MQVNVQFLQQLQPEWSRFVTVVKQSKEIDTISYHTLFDILKKYQNEVNDICAERIAKSANPLALLAAAQPYSDNYYQAPKPQRTNTTSSSTRPSASTRHKGKEIAKPVTPQSESVSEEDSDPEQAQRDKDMQKNLALLAKYFKKLYKPTNNNLRTSSNSRNKTEDTTPRYNNDNQSGQFGNQRTMTVAGARETVGSQVVQQNGIQCFNCKGFGHYAKECRKPKRVKDYTYHKEKMMMCKQAEHGVPLQAEQADWLADTDEEIDEQELEAHYSFMAKIQEVLPEESSSTDQPLEQVQNHDENNVFANERRHSEQPESINDTYVLEKDDSNVTPDSSNICNNDNQVDQNAAECVDERVALANLIANLTLDTEENKTILKQLKKANASLTQEMEECKTNLDETNRALGEATSCRDSCLIALQNKQNEFEKYKAFNDRTIDYGILQTNLNETIRLLALKDIEIKEGLKTKAYEISVLNQKHDELVKKSLLTKSQLEGRLKEKTKVILDLKVKEEKDIDKMIEMDKQLKFLNEIVYTRNQSIQTIHMLAPKCSTYNGRPTFANPRYLKKAQSEKPCLYEIPYDNSDHANRFAPDREETMTLANESRSKLNKDYVKPYDYTKQNSLYEIFKAPSLEYLYQLERTKEVRKTMWRKPFVRTKPNIAKNVAFLPVSKSISKSRQVFNDMTFNINQFREIVDQTWFKHTSDYFRVPTAMDMEVLIKTLLMPLSIKTQNDSFRFEHELKTEMHEDFEYVKSLEKEIDELESEKADFSNIYDLLLEEYKDTVKPYDYTRQNSLYEIFKAPSLEYLYQLERGKEVRKTMWRKPFVRTKPNIAKNVAFLPVSKSISKSRQVFNEMTFNINQFREIVDQTWFKHTSDYFRVPTAHDMELLIKTFLMPLSIKSQNDSFRFEHELKTEMHEDFEYVKSLEKEIDELESEKANFSNMYDLLLEECVSKDVICSYLHSLSELNAHTELQCMYLHKVKECECLAQKLSKQTESVNNEVDNKLLKSFAELKKHSISLELSLQHNIVKIQLKKQPSLQRNAFICISKRTIVQLILFIVDSGCTKHMTGNLKLLCNFVEKFLGTVRFGNDQFAPILGYGDLNQGNVMIKRVYYIEGLNHNLFSVGQFCDADLEVDLQGNDLLTAWLWHRRLSHLNFDYITLLSKKDIVTGLPKLKYVKDQLCSSCEMSKAKRSSFKSKYVPSSKGRLNLLHMDLCGPMRVASINGKKYILVIVDDYSRYTWTLFLRSKDETPEVLKDFLTMIQRNLQA